MLTTNAIAAEQIKPMPGRVLVRKAEKAEKSAGGIILPETHRALSQLGEVVTVGEKVEVLKRGDVVVFSIYSGAPCIAATDAAEDLLFVRETDVLATIEP